MTRHRHTWQTTSFTTLTLPDREHWFEAALSWRCRACGEVVSVTGHIHQRWQAQTPDWWEARLQEERRQQTALALAAQREEKVRIR